MFAFAKDEKTDELHRMATQYHDKKDFNIAVNLLKQAKECMIVSEVNYGIERWIRLPKNLQKVGLFEEALIEFNFLIHDIDRRNTQYSSHLGKVELNKMKRYDLSVIYEAMALVYKWEGISDKRYEYEKLSRKYGKK